MKFLEKQTLKPVNGLCNNARFYANYIGLLTADILRFKRDTIFCFKIFER